MSLTKTLHHDTLNGCSECGADEWAIELSEALRELPASAAWDRMARALLARDYAGFDAAKQAFNREARS